MPNGARKRTCPPACEACPLQRTQSMSFGGFAQHPTLPPQQRQTLHHNQSITTQIFCFIVLADFFFSKCNATLPQLKIKAQDLRPRKHSKSWPKNTQKDCIGQMPQERLDVRKIPKDLSFLLCTKWQQNCPSSNHAAKNSMMLCCPPYAEGLQGDEVLIDLDTKIEMPLDDVTPNNFIFKKQKQRAQTQSLGLRHLAQWRQVLLGCGPPGDCNQVFYFKSSTLVLSSVCLHHLWEVEMQDQQRMEMLLREQTKLTAWVIFGQGITIEHAIYTLPQLPHSEARHPAACWGRQRTLLQELFTVSWSNQRAWLACNRFSS